MHRKTAFLLLACLLWALPLPAGAEEASISDLFQEAYRLESQGDIPQASAIYEKILGEAPGDVFAGEALYRLALIQDEKLRSPAEALKLYRQYLDQYHGRQSRRAEARVAYLSTFEKADPDAYRTFLAIIEAGDDDHPDPSIRDMRAFVAKNPDFPGLDEALLWLGGKLRGPKRLAREKDELAKVAQAMEVYERVIREFPGTRSRVIAWKNLGDCHLMLNNYREARKCYTKTLEEGGDFGRRLVGQYMFMVQVESRRDTLFRVVAVAMPLLAGVLFLLIPMDRKILAAGLKKGLLALAFFLPVAGALTGVTWMLTDPLMGNISGREPFLVAILMGITAAGLLLAALAAEAGRQRGIRALPFSAALLGLMICAVYSAYYLLDLLPYVERLFL
ncbi:MAG: tetratricopeptide repeat protein [Pseudomonadota bacterium]